MIVTTHAVERYRERVKPAFTFQQAKAELEALLAGSKEIDPPADSVLSARKHPGSRYFQPCDGIVFVSGPSDDDPAVELVTTVLIRMGDPKKRASHRRWRDRNRNTRATQQDLV